MQFTLSLGKRGGKKEKCCVTECKEHLKVNAAATASNVTETQENKTYKSTNTHTLMTSLLTLPRVLYFVRLKESKILVKQKSNCKGICR